MLKKTLLRGLNLLKLSTWITSIVSVFLLLIVAFFVTFPQTIKTSLEERLSEISGLEVSVEKLSFEFQDNELLLAVRGLDFGAAGLNPIASIDVLRWDANLLAQSPQGCRAEMCVPLQTASATRRPSSGSPVKHETDQTGSVCGSNVGYLTILVKVDSNLSSRW